MSYEEILNSLETQRRKVVSTIYTCIIIGVVLVIIGAIAFSIFGAMFGLIFAFIIYAIASSSGITKYKREFKNQLMPLLISKTNLDLKYDYAMGLSEYQVLESRLFKRPDRYKSEDLLYGKIDDVSFISSDVRMEERRETRDSKGHRHVSYVPYFNGRWFIYEFNKQFNGIIQIKEASMFEGVLWGTNVERIYLEDAEFNKKFKTYATNQHDAFYVLTPTLIVNIKKLEQRYSGRIYFSFIGKMLHIAVYNSKDNFEPPLMSPITDDFLNKQCEDILILKDIITELNLNNKIFI